MNLYPRQVHFKISEYISKGIDLLKKDYGTFILSLFLLGLLSMIPFCGLMGRGNFYKICYKIDTGKPVSAGEIFDFEDFTPYFMLQLFCYLGFFACFVPIGIIGSVAANFQDNFFLSVFSKVLFLAAIIFILVILLMAYYIPALITFKKVNDIKQAWKMSRIMTQNNLLEIVLFIFVIGFLSQLGVILCFVGLILTIPFLYTAQYFSYKDAMEQIEVDEIKEIGLKEY